MVSGDGAVWDYGRLRDAAGNAQAKAPASPGLALPSSWRLEIGLRLDLQQPSLPIQSARKAANLPVGGRFKTDDLQGFLDGLEAALPISIRRTADGSVYIDPRH